jgi:LPXTG-motif cell wall-anchored protein
MTDFNSSNGCSVGDVELTIQPQGGSVTPWLTIPSASIVDGDATTSFTAPGSPGNYDIVATRGQCSALAILEVTPSTTAAPTTAAPAAAPVLPATGRSSDGLVWLALLTLLLGGGMVSLAARRR